MSGEGSKYTVPLVMGWSLDSAKSVSRLLSSASKQMSTDFKSAGSTFDASHEYWRGHGGEDARESSRTHADDAVRSASVIGAVAEKFDTRVSELEGEVSNLPSKVTEALSSEFDFYVEDDGTVNSERSNMEWLRVWKSDYLTKLAEKEGLENFLTIAIRGSLARIEDIDRRGAEELRTVLGGLSDRVKYGVVGTPDDPRLAEILRRYQTAPSEGGARLWPSGVLLQAIRAVDPAVEPVFMTPEEIVMLATMGARPNGLDDLVDFFAIRSQASGAAEQQHAGPRSISDGHGDAFRHTYWNALMTQRFGEDWTRQFATAHEQLGGNPPPREAMDLYNNEIGRQLAREHPEASPEELAAAVDRAVRDGRTLVIGADDEIAWSDRVAEHSTGAPSLTDIPLPAGER